MKMIRNLLFILLMCTSLALQSQELDFNVKVTVSPTLKQVDPKVFNGLERAIEEFFNNNKWTDDEFERDERIKGNIQITIVEDPSPTSFVADILIQSIRPVYNSDYSSQVINYYDGGIPFSYVESQPLENNINSYKDNLSSVLLYYIHYILGVDYDTFSPQGGQKYFQIAQNIVQVIPAGASSDNGWSVSVDNSRADMIETMLNPRTRKLRDAYYYYHRLGLDESANDIGKAKAAMVSALKDVQAVNAAAPNSIAVQMFMDGKRNEIVEIFKQSDSRQINQLYDILTEIDPSQTNLYNQLRGR
ncbi:type IX secretion system protein PorD [Portibacter lacus]|uniref:DUF4835 domain-containing protein n=1 Tax=Portibacter lacus TaxID=1099794 RepID=A0AA37SR52_9BACT|nr:DUF4835 family protein [Portibacter lacus]GLR19163.1 DUF4835 domain-containing protein [Portibacter lacus]